MSDEPTTSLQRSEELSIALRREQVAKLYQRQKLPMQVIADMLKVSPSTISRDVDAIEEAALALMEKDVRKMVRKMDRHWNDVIVEAWNEYERSKEPLTESTSQRIAAGRDLESDADEDGGADEAPTPAPEKSLVKVVRKTRSGNPRYLALIIAATEKLAKLHRLGGFVTEPAIQIPISPGANVVFYIPDNGRPVRASVPEPPEPSAAPRTMDAEVTAVSQSPAPPDETPH